MSFAKRALIGAAWTVGSGVGSRIVTAVGTFAMTYFLSPQTLGEVSVAAVLMLTTKICSDLGVDQYIVAFPKSGRDRVFNALVLSLLTAIAAGGILLALADPLADLFGARVIADYVPGFVLAFLLWRAAIIPERILARDLRFKALSLGLGASELTYVAVSLGLAAAGWGGHAIVWGNVVQAGLKLVVFALAADRAAWLTPARVTLAHWREILRYGFPVSIGGIAGFASTRWDNLIISYIYGPATLGIYNLAYNLAAIPSETISATAGDVLMPSFAQMEQKGRRHALLRAMRFIAIVITPLAVGLGAIADTLVAAVFNEEWQGIAPMLTILALLSVIMPVNGAIHVYLKSSGLARAAMSLQLLQLASLLIAIATFGRVHILAACAAPIAAFLVYTAAGTRMLAREHGVPPGGVAAAVLRPLLAAMIMAVAVLATRLGLQQLGLGFVWLQLALEIAAGALTYVAMAFVFAGPTARELLSLLREAFVLRGRAARTD